MWASSPVLGPVAQQSGDRLSHCSEGIRCSSPVYKKDDSSSFHFTHPTYLTSQPPSLFSCQPITTTMAGSSTPTFPWNPTSIEVALDTVLNVIIQPRDRFPFQESNLIQVVSKLNARIPQTPSTAALRNVTVNDLRALLEDQHQLFNRVCDLANLPSVIGFSSRTYKIMMSHDKYLAHIQAHPEDEELIVKPIPNFFYLFMFFGNGIMPGDVRRRRASTTYYANNERGRTTTGSSSRRSTAPATVQPHGNNNDDDDFMPDPPPVPTYYANNERGRTTTGSRSRRSNNARRRTTTPTVEPQAYDNDDDDFMPDPSPVPRRR